MRNFLLDTHALIWFITDNSQLPADTKRLIENKQNGCFVSIVSLWEISIKHSIGKLQLGTNLEEIFKLIAQTEFDILHISPKSFTPKCPITISSPRSIRSGNDCPSHL